MSGDGLPLPPAGGGVSDETAAFAAGLIDRSGKAPVIEAALARGSASPAPSPPSGPSWPPTGGSVTASAPSAR